MWRQARLQHKILKDNSQNTTQNDELITNGRLENEKSNDVQKDGCWKLYSNNKKLTQILKLKSVTEICI